MLKYILKSFLEKFIKNVPIEILHFFHLSITSITTQFVRLFTGIYNARLLTPYLYATNASISTLVRYLSYSHLGAQNGLNRQLPIEIGKKNHERFKIYLDSTFTFLTFINIILFLLFMMLRTSDFSYYDIIPNTYFLDIYLLASGTLFYQFFYSYLVSTSNFKMISALRLKFDVTSSIISVGAVFFFSLHGLLYTQVASLFTQIIIMMKKVDYKVRLRISLKHLVELMRIGAFILVASLLVYFFSTIDFVYVSSLLIKKNVGLYGFAITLVGFFKIYATSMSDILAPKIGKHFGENNEQPISLGVFVTDYIFIFILATFLIASVFFFIIPIIIKFFLPDYLGSIKVFYYLILAAIPMTVYIPAGHVITVLKRQKSYITIIVFFTIILFGLLKTFTSSNSSIEEISFIVMIISFMVSNTIIIYSNYIVFKNELSPKKIIKYCITIVLLICLLFISIDNMVGVSDYEIILFALIKLAIFIFILFILFYYFDKANTLTIKLKTLIRYLVK